MAEMSQPGSPVEHEWVDFILVTANDWNGPIKEFVLTFKTLDSRNLPDRT